MPNRNIALVTGFPTHDGTVNTVEMLTSIGHTVTVVNQADVTGSNLNSYDLIMSNLLNRNDPTAYNHIKSYVAAGKPVIMGAEGSYSAGIHGSPSYTFLASTLRISDGLEVIAESKAIEFSTQHYISGEHPKDTSINASDVSSWTYALRPTLAGRSIAIIPGYIWSHVIVTVPKGTTDLDGNPINANVVHLGFLYGAYGYSTTGINIINDAIEWAMTAPHPLVYDNLSTDEYPTNEAYQAMKEKGFTNVIYVKYTNDNNPKTNFLLYGANSEITFTKGSAKGYTVTSESGPSGVLSPAYGYTDRTVALNITSSYSINVESGEWIFETVQEPEPTPTPIEGVERRTRLKSNQVYGSNVERTLQQRLQELDSFRGPVDTLDDLPIPGDSRAHERRLVKSLRKEFIFDDTLGEWKALQADAQTVDLSDIERRLAEIEANSGIKTEEHFIVETPGITAFTLTGIFAPGNVAAYINGIRYFQDVHFTVDREMKYVTWTYAATNGGFDLFTGDRVSFVY